MGGSLRAGLLGYSGDFGRDSPSSFCSRPATQRKLRSALTWKALHGVGRYRGLSLLKVFPSSVAMWAGIVKLVVGAFMASLGGIGLVVEASLSPLGGGLWAGAVVGLSGFLAVCASRRPQSQVYIVSLLGVSLLSLSASGLLLLLSAAAWAADTGAAPPGFLSQVGLDPIRPATPPTGGLSPPVLVSGGLVLLAAVDCLVSSVCVAIAARQLCRALAGLGAVDGQGRGYSEGHNRKERLYRWLGQQKTIFPIGTTAAGASRRTGNTAASIPSVCQFVPLTESSSTASLDQLTSHDDRHNAHAHHAARHSSTIPSSHMPRTNDSHDDRSTYMGRSNTHIDKVSSQIFIPHNGKTFSKFANIATSHGRYDTSRYDVAPYKNVYAQNPYSHRSSSGKQSHSILYSGNSTIHSTLASSLIRPTKCGQSVTTKNSTGSSQLTTSAYFSSASESRQPKSAASFPLKTNSKFSHLSVTNLSDHPSLPHALPSSSSVVLMAAPPAQPASLYGQYSPPRRRSRPVSERFYPHSQVHPPQQYYSKHRVPPHQMPSHQVPTNHQVPPQHHSHHKMASQHQMHPQPPQHQMHPQQQHTGYYTLQHNAVDPPVAFQSLPRQHSQYVQVMAPHYPHAFHQPMYYPHVVAPVMPNYHYVQDYDKRKRRKKGQQPTHSAVYSSKLSRKNKNIRKLKKSKKRSERKLKELTDEQIDQSYTGLDRTIAEGFINTMMEPAMSSMRPVHGY